MELICGTYVLMHNYYDYNILHRWKQLVFVTLFYLFFVYIYALFGVQWIGGLPKTCVRSMENQ